MLLEKSENFSNEKILEENVFNDLENNFEKYRNKTKKEIEEEQDRIKDMDKIENTVNTIYRKEIEIRKEKEEKEKKIIRCYPFRQHLYKLDQSYVLDFLSLILRTLSIGR